MRVLRFVIGLALALSLHIVSMRLSPFAARAVDWFALAVVISCLDCRPAMAILLGAAAGWASDAISGVLYGLHGIALAVVGWAVARLSQQLTLRQPAILMAVLGGAVVLEDSLLGLLLRLLRPDLLPPDPRWIAARALATAAIGLLVLSFAGRVAGRFRSWRTTRPVRVRLENR